MYMDLRCGLLGVTPCSDMAWYHQFQNMGISPFTTWCQMQKTIFIAVKTSSSCMQMDITFPLYIHSIHCVQRINAKTAFYFNTEFWYLLRSLQCGFNFISCLKCCQMYLHDYLFQAYFNNKLVRDIPLWQVTQSCDISVSHCCWDCSRV